MEVWKEIKGFEGYYMVSTLGNVKSIERKVKSKVGYRIVKSIMLKMIIDKDGYYSVNLKKSQVAKKMRVHRLVCDAFITNKQNRPQVNHINGIKNDNRLENLEWSTLSENRIHAYKTGLQNGINRRGVKNNFNKLTEQDIITIRHLYSEKTTNKYTMKQISEKYNVTQSCIQSIINKRNWKWL